MKRSLGLLLGLFAIALSIGIYYYFKPVASLEQKDAAFSMDATTLFKHFDENENAANTKYLDKVIEVRGTISKIDQEKIRLETAFPFSVICELEPGFLITPFKTGDTIICRGVCSGKLMDVVLTRCIIIQKQ